MIAEIPDAFRSLEPATRTALVLSGRDFHVAKGTQILHAHEAWQTAYWLKNGIVRMYHIDRDGNEHNKRFFTQGSFFWPVSAVMREQAAGFSMAALASTTGTCWSFSVLRAAFNSPYEWLEFNHLWTDSLLTAKLKREQELLQLSATERYVALCQDEPALIRAVPDHHLASYIGITPVSLSRIKKSLNI